MHSIPTPAFIGCDWGSSKFRLALLGGDASVIAEYADAGGIVSLREHGLDTKGVVEHLKNGLVALASVAKQEITTLPLIISGMAGSSIGMCEVPYAPLPFSVDGKGCSLHLLRLPAVHAQDIFMIPGCCSSVDVMRGEETEAVGLLADPVLEDATLLLPGTHSKHLRVKERMVTSFRSYMTGELFHTLAHHTILGKSVLDTESDPFDAHGMACFLEGVDMSKSQDPLHDLFTLRSRVLLNRISIPGNIHRLSGLLIGMELRSAAIDPGFPLVVGGSKTLQHLYLLALQECNGGLEVLRIPEEHANHAVWKGQSRILEYRSHDPSQTFSEIF